MDISDEVKLILDRNLITHGRLKLNALSRSKHHAVTDYQRVFVKVLKHGIFSYANMLQAELDFAFASGYGTNPLMDSIRHQDSNYNLFIMSAWEYEKQVSILHTLNPIQIAQAAGELYKIHSLPKYDRLRGDVDNEFREYGEILTSYSFKFLTPSHQVRIKEMYQNILLPATESLALNYATNVVCHGRPTLEKAVLKGLGVQWVDYELVRAAPREYDLSQVFLQLHHRLNRPDLWHLFKTQYEQKINRPLSRGLMEQFTLLHLARTALQLASTTLQSRNEGPLMEFLNELGRLTSGKASLETTNLRSFAALN